jgi:orotidine-5'-phosphate decarboxylase
VGAQGGDAKATVQAGLTAQGLISVNSSRAILYASNGADFADAARREALKTRDVLNAAMA